MTEVRSVHRLCTCEGESEGVDDAADAATMRIVFHVEAELLQLALISLPHFADEAKDALLYACDIYGADFCARASEAMSKANDDENERATSAAAFEFSQFLSSETFGH